MGRPRPKDLVRKHVRELKRTLPSAYQGDVDAVHEARVITRRLRSILPLFRPRRQARAARRDTRRLTKFLGPIRELDVSLEVLERVERRAGVPRTAVTAVRRALRAERRQAHRALRTTLKVRGLREVQRLSETLEANRRRDRRARTAKDAWARVASSAIDLRAALRAAGRTYRPKPLHDLRVSVKKLRYALEVASDVAPVKKMPDVKPLTRAQRLLGDIHDLEVLAERTRNVAVRGACSVATRGRIAAALVPALEGLVQEEFRRYASLRAELRRVARSAGASARRVIDAK